MSSNEDSDDDKLFRNVKTKKITKNKSGFLGSQKSFLSCSLDKNCLYKFPEPLVRIEYPGQVKNPDRAIETLGGFAELEKSIEGTHKLELKFHPKNLHGKGIVADQDSSVGILLKVKQNLNTQECSYEILGATNMSFKFKRMCDFHYLPLAEKGKYDDSDNPEVKYSYEKVLPKEIPSLQWFTSKEISTQPPFLISSSYARFDTPQIKFHLNSSDTLLSVIRPDTAKPSDLSKKKVREKDVTVHSLRICFMKSNIAIPDQPLISAMAAIKDKLLQPHFKKLQNLFQERPVWRKAAIMHKLQISNDTAKYALPGVAYYCTSGPWRTCWLKFGYDPTIDYKSHIYQVLDFRIRSTEGMQIKVKSKRGALQSLLSGGKPADGVTEEDYLIRPNKIPSARQMFYQYCDILIPEVQEMLLKLPKLPASRKFDRRNGWLPFSFQEHCREIVNKYVFDAVHQKLLEESKVQTHNKQEKQLSESRSTYCSKMFENIKRGVFRAPDDDSKESHRSKETVIEQIYLSDDEDDEQIDADDVVNSFPERIPDEDDDENDEDNSDCLEIDLEAVEEVNKIVSTISSKKLE